MVIKKVECKCVYVCVRMYTSVYVCVKDSYPTSPLKFTPKTIESQ